MIARNLSRLKVEKGSLQTTSYVGLPLLTELAHQTGLIGKLDAIPGIWERHGDYRTSDYALGLAMTLIAGGEGLDDTRLLRDDTGLRRLSFPDFPAPNSFGRFLSRFSNRTLYRFGEVVSSCAVQNLRDFKVVTLDVDSTLVESDKKLAQMSYKGFTGYNPLLAWLAEPNVFLAGVFRNGNASPQSHLTSLLKYCVGQLPPGIELRLRSDSAGYKADLIEYCQAHAIPFTISGDLDSSVREAIDQIPEKAWQLVVRGNDTFLLAETIHAMGHRHHGKLPAFRLIVTRRLTGQLELFDEVIKYRTILTDFPQSWTAEQVLDHHNGRGTAEKMIAELKNGFGLDKLPCADLKANAAFFQVCLLAFNLVQTFKRFALPADWQPFCVKNLRFRLLCRAAIVVRHARRLILKVTQDFPFFETFREARWAILSPALAPAVT